MILYEGPSALDGAPVVAIATGITGKASRNAKTGAMVQTWIMRADIAPHHAVRTGADASVCGDCRHRPANDSSCYVTTFQAPRSVWEAYKRGVYTRADLGTVASLGAGRVVRLGSYGDPAAVPFAVWRALTSEAESWTGYTHQWAAPETDPELAALCMASVDSEAEAREAQADGWRTFRVRTPDAPVMAREFICPASAEAGHRTDCASCRACGGTGAKAKANPVIIAHGRRAKRFTLTRNGVAA